MNQLPLNKNELPLIREMLTKYKQGYISGLIPGSNITFSPSECRNKIVSSTGSGGIGGGSPAGSSNQIQINQSGAFFADSTFQKSDTDFNVGLDHTQQSAVTFTGAGLDDLILTGAFSGTVPTTYTVTIDGLNKDIFILSESDISGGSFAVSDVVTNGTGGTATITGVGLPLLGNIVLTVNITAGTFSDGDTIDNGSGVTAINLGPNTSDTINWTDGVTTQNNIGNKEGFIQISNGLVLKISTTGHTLSDSWTWTYSTANQNVLDFSNGTYKFGTDFGTDYFGYEVGNNILGFGLKGAVNTWINGSDFAVNGIYNEGGVISSGTTIQIGSNSSASLTEIDKSYASVSDGTDSGTSILRVNQFGLSNTLSSGEHGITQLSGLVTVGNLYGGNNTKITIDDVNEQITISNLPAYDDDTAAGVGGLTAGMVYMTTGSGSAPLNAAGILMIKQ